MSHAPLTYEYRVKDEKGIFEVFLYAQQVPFKRAGATKVCKTEDGGSHTFHVQMPSPARYDFSLHHPEMNCEGHIDFVQGSVPNLTVNNELFLPRCATELGLLVANAENRLKELVTPQ